MPQYDGRLLDPNVGGNISEYHNPAVNRLIDRALAEPDQARRAALWGEIDQRIMRDAPLVPLVWENYLVPVGLPGPRLEVRPLDVHARPHRPVAGPPEPLTAASAQGRPGPDRRGRPAPCRCSQRRPEWCEARSSAHPLGGVTHLSTQPSGRQQTGSRRPL